MATKVIDLDVSQGCRPLTGLEGYDQALCLLRWQDTPLGRVFLPVREDQVGAAALLQALDGPMLHTAWRCLLDQRVGAALKDTPARLPLSATVVVCTRNRPDDLRRCLASLVRFADATTDLLVIDNDPPDDGTAEVCRAFGVRRVVEPRRGLNWARSRGLMAARGEVVAFIDDDAVASPQWLEHLRAPFHDPTVAAATGLVMPLELENTAQEQFEAHCTFVRGFRYRRFHAANTQPIAAGRAGAGACMAVRRRLADELGLFRVEMDCGTVTESGGDTYAFYRLIALGYTVVYEPRALAWHRHRRDDNALRRVLYGYGVGTYVYLLRCLLRHREIVAVREGLSWLRHHHLPELFAPLLPGRRPKQPVHLRWEELLGVRRASLAYLLSRRREEQLRPLIDAAE